MTDIVLAVIQIPFLGPVPAVVDSLLPPWV